MSSFFRRELLYAAIVCLTPLGFGYTIGYPSPAEYYWTITNPWSKWPKQSGLFVAITQLTGAIGPYIPSILFNFGLGRRLVTSLVDIVSIILWVILIFLNEKLFWMGFVIRILQGFMLGAASSLGPLLLLEVAPAEQTGLYGTFNQIFIVIGIIILYLIGEYQHPRAMCIYSAVSHALQLGLIWLIPETSITQQNKGGDDKENKEEEKKESIFQKQYLWPLTVLILIMLTQQFSGINAILAGLFKNANINGLKPGIQSVIATLAQLIACFFSGGLIKVLGRRVMWSISGIVCAASLIIFGFNSKYHWSNVLPVVLIFLYQFGFGLGLAPMPWYSSPEMFPPSVRPLASSINGMTSWLFSFIIVYASPAMKDSKMGELGLFLFYGIITIAGTIFGFWFIKEPNVNENETLDNDGDKPQSEL
ncbi:major facilitator superfamily protein [Trichomonas vaginalis G3]|uniref:Major facilitator superfamily protein n=1 Tax=Trichomonas vaginalis (strain ATCC PRA-98 / G3) TaxID=412133 RepID=A2G8B0_TRIV3|nr:major facilitator superfamily transporter [Trichomonas vaginalis G3]EAX86609.1 major facilitator superfamily protein [Trichomonas vaginalis G3]KAI5539909.1 glucose import [Trichomonas vaginalis G3]|eukprot:XP_001299539.1 major facilitator superfamily transporter [Trichomonas vaginalis G3]